MLEQKSLEKVSTVCGALPPNSCSKQGLTRDDFVFPSRPSGVCLSLDLVNIVKGPGDSSMAFYLLRARLNRQLAAVMDHCFRDPQIEPVGHGEGWQRMGGLPKLREAEAP